MMTFAESNSAGDRRDWQAFCYVSGDMSPDEAADFETLLEEDQSAREALAGTVELTRAVVAASSSASSSAADRGSPCLSPSDRPRSVSAIAGWMRPVVWMTAGAAACLAMVLTVDALRGPAELAQQSSSQPDLRVDPAKSAAAQPADQRALEQAVLWSQIRQVPLAEEPEWLAGLVPGADELDRTAIESSTGEEPVSADLPSWMTAAVFVDSDEQPSADESTPDSPPSQPESQPQDN